MRLRVIQEVSRYKRTLESACKRAEKLLTHADKRFGNIARAKRHATNPLEYTLFDSQGHKFYENSNMRVAKNYIETQTVLDIASGGELKGKKVLHIGASTGVYAHFLQEYYQADAIALDRNEKALDDAKQRGVKTVVAASAIPETRRIFSQTRRGLKIGTIRSRMPIPTGSMDFVISENFLFSNFHKQYATPGFEERNGSIRKSETALRELNRVLRVGGKAIVTHVHGTELPNMQKYKKGYVKHGFIVEEVYKGELPISGTIYTAAIVFKKIKNEY
jgi:ubiquinone/menaquinone biosynthesis C-methylase UbiE